MKALGKKENNLPFRSWCKHWKYKGMAKGFALKHPK